MMTRKTIGLLLTMVLALGAGSSAGAAQDRDRSFDVAPGGLLDVETSVGGELRVEGWDRDRVEVRAELTGRNADEVILDIEETGDGVKITTRFPERRNWSASVNLEVRVPRRYDVRLQSMGGSVYLSGLSGEFRGQTMGGRIELIGLDGSVRLRTMGGSVELSDSTVDGTVSTMGGNVVIRNVEGNIEGSSMGGHVRYDNVRRPRDDGGSGAWRVGSPLELDTQGGKIEVNDAPDGARLSTMGGSIRAGRVGKFIKARTMGGRISVQEIDGRVDVSTMGGGVDVTLVQSGAADSYDVEIEARGGDVRLVVPEDFSMSIDIAVSYTKKSKRNYGINSDFEVKQDVSADWEYEDGEPRKTIRARGRVAGGQYRVHITNVNGNVHLLKGR